MLTKKEQYTHEAERNKPNEYSRTYEASPQFPFTNAASIAASGALVWDLHRDNPTSEKYGVMTNLFIVNNSAQLILIYPNQQSNRAIAVGAGVQVEFDRNSLGGGFTSITIVNGSASTAINANEIRTMAYKQGVTHDQLIKNAHRLFVKSIGLGMNKGAR